MLRLLLASTALFAACSTPDIRVPPTAPTSFDAEDRISIQYASVEVTTATLPAYADSEDIVAEAEDGTLVALGPLWSDEPSRAVTLQVAGVLRDLTGKTVAPEPWPFRDFAAVKLDIRFADFHATARGTFRVAGQYFVAPDEGGQDIAHSFEIEVGIGGEASANDISVARTIAINRLTSQIAKDALR